MPIPTRPRTGTAWRLGGLTVHRVDEALLPPPTGSWLLPAATADVVAGQRWLHPDFADAEGALRLSSHTFAIETSGLRVLVDTGIGNGKTRANPAWHNLRSDYLERLSAIGFAPESVDLVIMTHLHTDHVGWNTHAVADTWVPTFPNARYVTSRAEREFWAGYDMDAPRKQMFRDSVHPIEDAGLLDLIDVPSAGIDIAPGLRLLPTPGHTPGQVAVQVGDGGAEALITGDCVHHPIQLAHPDIVSCIDIDPARAVATRHALLESLADTETLLLGSHFPSPTAGRVIRAEGSYRLIPADAEKPSAAG
ncbi:MBL fold metallo-hydrolase [Nocardia terpenica]|uniref:MBL fold metallo-hydrolase n=1 Tax=Nocardia terpenica TaxID=455432 RepID=UPI001894E217|nr:MBL fold metallo-hydrolase [Nocardia terpenica]MBF6061227.1 MBL fold metallo-hydrolase [Nocardia terpenica]MBF6105544.1 MBL fold metallo-hydrolase [Nocardia terpenica]MBF6112986.1 MBL fold metallo-hydrolase [Nocardia terpenica]MBF6119116.1 MBL fold metallo-hydrolase [Nocardia terpenica]MBF6152764.1 MBL fold metallo-hydrolase [Nocardia terpenica]